MGCLPGYYGQNCSLPCPHNCFCHMTHGTCLSCLPGYMGQNCKESKWYFKSCQCSTILFLFTYCSVAASWFDFLLDRDILLEYFYYFIHSIICMNIHVLWQLLFISFISKIVLVNKKYYASNFFREIYTTYVLTDLHKMPTLCIWQFHTVTYWILYLNQYVVRY